MSDTDRIPGQIVRRNALMLGVAMFGTFAAVRIHLAIAPNADFNVGSHNIHHLFTGLVLITLGGIPLAVLRGNSRGMDMALVAFGVGLGLALDEWVYLIVTDATNASYLLPVSFWGGLIAVGVAIGYAVGLAVISRRASAAASRRRRS